MMLTFYLECKRTEAVIERINSGYYDSSIENWFYNRLRDEPLTEDPACYFDMQVACEEVDELLNITMDQYTRQSKIEKEISEIFANRVRNIRSQITDDMVKEKYKDFVNSKTLFLDIEKRGFPILFINNGCNLFAEFNQIVMDEFYVTLKGEGISYSITHLSDNLKDGHLNMLITDYEKCYHIYNSDAEYAYAQLYWPVKKQDQ